MLVLRRRRWSPKRLAGLVGWYAADHISANDGDALATWVDLSGNGNDLAQTTASNKPLYKVNIINGRPAVRFDGSNDFIFKSFTLNQPHTIIIVAVHRSMPVAQGRIVNSGSGTSGIILATQIIASDTLQQYAGSSVDSGQTIVATTPYIATGVFSGASSRVRLSGNGVTGNPGTDAAGGISLGASTSAAQPSPVDIAEVGLWNVAHVLSDIQLAERTWGTKYNITVA